MPQLIQDGLSDLGDVCAFDLSILLSPARYVALDLDVVCTRPASLTAEIAAEMPMARPDYKPPLNDRSIQQRAYYRKKRRNPDWLAARNERSRRWKAAHRLD